MIVKKQRNSQKFIVDIIRQNLPFILFALGQIISVLAFIYPNEKKMHFLESSIARGSAGCFISYFIMFRNKKPMADKILNDSEIYQPLFLRNCLIIIHANIFALSQLQLSQPVVQTINCTGPVFTLLADYFQNKVEINKVQGYGIVGVVAGSVLIANQKWISNIFHGLIEKFDQDADTLSNSTDLKDHTTQIFVIIALFMAVSLWGIAQTLVKRFAIIDSSVINMHFASLYMITNGIGYPILVEKRVQFTQIIKAFLFCGIPSTIAALFMIKATKMTQQTGVLTMMTFVAVLVGEGLSLFRYDQELQFFSLIGMIFIITGLGTVIFQVNKSNQ